MIVTLSCGCTVDDEQTSTIHEIDGRHYLVGANPTTFCVRCDLFRPCVHDVAVASHSGE